MGKSWRAETAGKWQFAGLRLPLTPAPGTHENRRFETILAALLWPAIFVGTRMAGVQGHTSWPLDSRLCGNDRIERSFVPAIVASAATP
jgi:hypothetical protein